MASSLSLPARGEKVAIAEEDDATIQALTRLIPIPKHERQRLMVLRETQLVDSDPEDIDLERILLLTRRIFKTAKVAISFVEVDRVVFKAKIGIDQPELPRELCLCAYTVSDYEGDVFLIPDARADKRFAHYPTVALGTRFYAGTPLVCEGLRIGSLCVADGTPRAGLTELEAAKLTGIASLLSTLISGRHKRLLKDQDAVAAMVAGVAHRLRAPLRAVNERAIAVREHIQACKEASTPPARLTEGAMLHCTLVGLLHDAQALQDEVERTLRSACSTISRSGSLMQARAVRSLKASEVFLPWERVWANLRAAATKRFDDAQLRWDVDELLRGEELRVGVQGLTVALDVALTLQRHLLGSERVHVECSLSLLSLSLSLQSRKAEDARAGEVAMLLRGLGPGPEEGALTACAYSAEERQTICRSAEVLCRSLLGGGSGLDVDVDGTMRLWVPCLCRAVHFESGAAAFFGMHAPLSDGTPQQVGTLVPVLAGSTSFSSDGLSSPVSISTRAHSYDRSPIVPAPPRSSPTSRAAAFVARFLDPILFDTSSSLHIGK